MIFMWIFEQILGIESIHASKLVTYTWIKTSPQLKNLWMAATQISSIIVKFFIGNHGQMRWNKQATCTYGRPAGSFVLFIASQQVWPLPLE